MSPSESEDTEMKHKLKINVSNKPESESVMTCKCVSIRERLLHFLLGDKHKVTILVPGSNVEEVTIYEAEKGSKGND